MSNSKVEFRHGIDLLEVPVVSGALDIYVGDNINYNANGYAKAASDTATELFAGIAMEELHVSATENSAAGKYVIKVLPAHAGNVVRRKLTATRATAIPGTDVYISKSDSATLKEVALATVSEDVVTNNVKVGKIAAFVSTSEVDVAF